MGVWNVGLRKLKFTYRFRASMKREGGEMENSETPGEANAIGLVKNDWDLSLRE